MADIDQTISIRYDGKDAENHEIDLYSLGQSLQGLARVASSVGNFAITHKHARHYKKQVVRVAAQGAKANCFTMDMVWNFVQQHQILSGSFGAIVAPLITYVLFQATKKEQEAETAKAELVSVLREEVSKDRDLINRLVDSVEYLATSMKPAARQTLEPLGTSCRTVTLKIGDTSAIFNEADKAASNLKPKDEITPTLSYQILITELDVERSTGKAYVNGQDASHRRIPITIMDPLIQTQDNIYATSLAKSVSINVQARGIVKAGQLHRLFVEGPV